ncbi:hypothetical protein K1T71_013109 [Dendrolimus kikuchii]|uniref:Uncharacterized protein n=1 Tax=Dendrolimus kikuchii TaxID=765133 RepID=A0ACC1CJ17_9NEOP|nr:hypothetical protein K1T71_013109 [Dendrolimus kikuchii]
MEFENDFSLKEWAKDKPLSILQLDPADRAVLRIAGRRWDLEGEPPTLPPGPGATRLCTGWSHEAQVGHHWPPSSYATRTRRQELNTVIIRIKQVDPTKAVVMMYLPNKHVD